MADEYEQIGGLLRSAREAAGLKVDDVVFRTRIPRSAVEALEADDFASFSSPVYAKGFLAQYSEFLNVDAQRWLDALEPGSFMPGGQMGTLLEGPEAEEPEGAAAPEPRGGLLAVLALLALSAALVFGAIKGYQFFEARLGADRSGPQPQPAAAAPEVPAAPPDPRPLMDKEDEEASKPPPRAIIVR